MNAYVKLMDVHGFVLGPIAREALSIVEENVSRADHVVDDIEWDRAFNYAMTYVIGRLPEKEYNLVVQYVRGGGIDFSGGLTFGVWKE